MLLIINKRRWVVLDGGGGSRQEECVSEPGGRGAQRRSCGPALNKFKESDISVMGCLDTQQPLVPPPGRSCPITKATLDWSIQVSTESLCSSGSQQQQQQIISCPYCNILRRQQEVRGHLTPTNHQLLFFNILHEHNNIGFWELLIISVCKQVRDSQQDTFKQSLRGCQSPRLSYNENSWRKMSQSNLMKAETLRIQNGRWHCRGTLKTPQYIHKAYIVIHLNGNH